MYGYNIGMDELLTDVGVYWGQRLFTRADTIVVGVSGGADSMALLHYLCHSGQHPAENIVAVCVNHLLRAEGTAEAEFVAQTAAEWGVTAIVKTAEPELSGDDTNHFSEEGAREVRYRLLQEVRQQVGAPAVLTAHHADDQVETVVMNLLRGSGASGLSGMRPISERMVAGEPLRIFRPFLAVWRSDILVYVQKYQIPYMEDASNKDVRFLRNRLRHELIPQLMSYNEQASQHIWQTAALLQDEQEGWQEFITAEWDAHIVEGAQFVRVETVCWNRWPVSVQRALLRRAIERLATLQGVTFDHIEKGRKVIAEGVHGVEWHLPHEIRLQIVYGTAVLSCPPVDETDLYDVPLLREPQAITLSVPSVLPLAGRWRMHIQKLEQIDWQIIAQNQNRWEAFLSVKEGEMIVRLRLAGERFRPLGMAGTMKVKDVMINEKMPAAVRNRWPIVADDEGVLWLTGYRVAQRAAVAPESEFVVHIKVYQEI